MRAQQTVVAEYTDYVHAGMVIRTATRDHVQRNGSWDREFDAKLRAGHPLFPTHTFFMIPQIFAFSFLARHAEVVATSADKIFAPNQSGCS